MAKKQGKVKAVSILELKEGMQVFHPRYYGIGKVEQLIYKFSAATIKFGNYRTVNVDISSLQTFVVEFTDYEYIPSGPCKNGLKKQLPLKYKQWSLAIEKGEVDSDKTINFEIMTKFNDGNGPDLQFAKIIPNKQIGEYEAFIGVGTGDGDLYVYGSFEAIKAAQTRMIANENMYTKEDLKKQ